MRLKQNGPRRPGRTAAGEFQRRLHRSTETAGVNCAALDGLAAEFVEQGIEAERCCLAVGLYDHTGLRREVLAHGLKPADFIGPDHAWLCDLLFLAAEQGVDLYHYDIEYNAVEDGIDREAARGYPKFHEWLNGLYYWTECAAADLPIYCETVREFRDRRFAALEHYAAFCDVLDFRAIPPRRQATKRGTGAPHRYPVRSLSA